MMAGSNRGMALISVLWITALLAVMAASFASSTRTETRLAHNHEEAAKAEALADAGVDMAVFKLLDLDPETAWRAGETVYAFSLGEGDVQVRIEDEDGKVGGRQGRPERRPAPAADRPVPRARVARGGRAADGRSDR
jgi:type II secretory pathway component PulK